MLALLVAACDARDTTPSVDGTGGALPVLPESGGAAGAPYVPAAPLAFLDGKVEKAAYAAPIAGGTLLVTKDGLAIAADPDRDRVFLVDLATQFVREVVVAPRDELGRVAEGPPGVAYVVARRGGVILALDLVAGTVSRRVPVCAAPRGVAYDAAMQSVHVACGSGLLVTLDAASLTSTRRILLDPDLRDVIVRGSELVVTRFKSSELLVLDAAGAVVRRATPAPDEECSASTVLYRATLAPGGRVYLAHQTASNRSVSTSPGGYGSSCGGGISAPFIGSADVDAPGVSDAGAPSGERFISVLSTQLAGASGPLDIAVSRDGGRVAVVATGNSWNVPTPRTDGNVPSDPASALRPTLFVAQPTAESPVSGTELGASSTKVILRGEPTAVAFDSRGRYVAQSREPATLELEDGTLITLNHESHADTGLALFHVNTGLGLACASCHPGGDEDGHTWHFNAGYRRTQPLAGGVTARAPFHWTGDLPALPDLINEVMLKRMALSSPPTAAQIEALGSWLDTIPAPSPPDDLDAGAVARGRAVFESGGQAACASCHSGPQLSDGKTHDVGTGGAFVTPTLLGAGSRTPLLHDGCAKSLVERFGRCGGGALHGDPSRLSPGAQADLIEFLRSL